MPDSLLVRLVPATQALNVGDNPIAFSRVVGRYLIRNKSAVPLHYAADAVATPDDAALPAGQERLVAGGLLVLHLYTSATGRLNGPGVQDVEVEGWAAPDVGLHPQGVHARAAAYAPGDIVTDAGGLYANTTAVVPDTRVDTFDRPDQEGWGTASDGHVWSVANAGGGTAQVLDGAGVLTATTGLPCMLLAPQLSSGDQDVLVRWKLDGDPAHSGALVAQLRNDAAALAQASAVVFRGGAVEFYSTADGDANDDATLSQAWAGADLGTLLWTRFRVVGTACSVRTWADGVPEPRTWDGQHTFTIASAARFVGVQGLAGAGDTLTVYSFSATTLSPTPADDPDHWTALVPAPAQAGVPVLHGPYTVTYSDIPHDGDTMTLWTPQVGDVILRLFPDWQTVVQWDHGALVVTQGANQLTTAVHGNIAQSQAGCLEMSGVSIQGDMDALWLTDDITQISATYVCHTADPVQINYLAQGSGADPGAGHVDLYALVSRAVAP